MNERRKAERQSTIRGASAHNSQHDADDDDLTNHPCRFCGEFLTFEEVDDEEKFCRWCRAKNLDIVFGSGV